MSFSRYASRHLASVLLAFCLAITLAACGDSNPIAVPSPDGPEPTVTAPVALPSVISVAGRFDKEQLAVLDRQVAIFEEANPDVQVELIEIKRDPAQYHDELEALLAQRDSGIDVLLLNNDQIPRFANRDLLVPLDGLAQSSGIDTRSFVPASLAASTMESTLMALPWTAHTGLLYYRQDLFEKYRLQPPAAWPDLQHSALQIMAGEHLEHGYVWQGAANASLTANTLEVASEFGAQAVDHDENLVIDTTLLQTALEQMVSLVATGASPQDIYTYSEQESYDALRSGDAVMLRGWSSAWSSLGGPESQLPGIVSVAPLPSSVLFGQGMALSAFSAHPTEAFRLMAFLAGHEQQAQRARVAGLAPTLRSVYEDAEMQADQPVLKSLYLALLNASLPPRTDSPGELSEIIYSEVNKMLRGAQDVETTAATIQRQMDDLNR